MEYLDHIDKNEQVLSSHPLNEIYTQNLRHRIVHVFIWNSKGELILQKRSKYKSFLPWYWVTSASGHVQSWEEYIEGAMRELQEELWINAHLTQTGYYTYYNEELEKRITTYEAIYDGEIFYNKHEVESIQYIHKDRLEDFLQTNDIHPELLFLLKK